MQVTLIKPPPEDTASETTERGEGYSKDRLRRSAWVVKWERQTITQNWALSVTQTMDSVAGVIRVVLVDQESCCRVLPFRATSLLGCQPIVSPFTTASHRTFAGVPYH